MDNPEMILNEQGITAVDRNDENKQLRIFHANGRNIIQGTTDSWETIDWEYKDGHVYYGYEITDEGSGY